MTLDLLRENGVPLEKQTLAWRELVPMPYSKLDDDAFTRMRVIALCALEASAALPELSRIEHQQRTLLAALHPPDQSALETTIATEQCAVELLAALAVTEPDPPLARVYRTSLLEHFDHLYRFAALYDRTEGKDANTLLQSYTDILPAYPAPIEAHAAYDKDECESATKLHACFAMAIEAHAAAQTLAILPTFADPLARQLCAELAQSEARERAIEDVRETALERALLHEAAEVYLYASCAQAETNNRLRAVYERFTDWELGQFHFVRAELQRIEKRDASEVLEAELPAAIRFESHRELIRELIRDEAQRPARHRDAPSEIIAAGYVWTPGGELARPRPRIQSIGRA